MQRMLDLIDTLEGVGVVDFDLSIAAFAGSSKYKHIFDVNMRMLPWMLANMPV